MHLKKTIRTAVLRTILSILPFAPALLCAQTADEDYAAVNALMKKERDPSLTGQQLALQMDEEQQLFLDKSLEFGETYPEDPRYWNLIVQSGYTPPLFIESLKPGIDEAKAAGEMIWGFVVRDEEKVAEFEAQHKERLKLLFQQDGLEDRVVGGAYGWWLMNQERKAWSEPSEENRKLYHDLMTRYWKALPENEYATIAAESYLRLLQDQAPEEVEVFKEELSEHSNPIISGWLAKKAREDEVLSDIANLKFTSLSGEEIDLGKMRGKTILVDFWATWCGPCIAELPNIRSAYEKYHDKGFEIIGVSLDRDAHEQKLRDFVVEREMPWPQYFDGKAWKGDLAQKYGINAIPAMILIAPDGSVASRQARGEALAPAIEELLKL